MKKLRRTNLPLLIIILIAQIIGCKKEDEKKIVTPTVYQIPKLSTDSVINITQFSAVCIGRVTDDGGNTRITCGICWSKNEIPEINWGNNSTHNCDCSGNELIINSGMGGTTRPSVPLTPNTKYYVRVFASGYESGIGYGNIISFTTLAYPVVVPQTKSVSNILHTSAICGGRVISDFDTTIIAKGVCWSTSQNPTITDTKTTDGSGRGDFVSRLTDLTPNTTYYVRSYATNKGGTGYGDIVSFTTLSSQVLGILTNKVTYITKISAISGGTISAEGLSSVIERGVCWSTSQNPTILDSRTSDGTGQGDFVSNMTGLNTHTKYFVRSYASIKEDTFYGSEESFTTNGSVTDIDGNVYNTVTIGTQEWMSENLRVTQYMDGVPLKNIADVYPAGYCSYQNEVNYAKEYGYLYNQYAVVNRGGLCPLGWRVPSSDEWESLFNYMGGKEVAGIKLKEAGTAHWASPNAEAKNESGFSSLPGGYWVSKFSHFNSSEIAVYYIEFHDIRNSGIWWSYDYSYNVIKAQSANISIFFTNTSQPLSRCGYSVRCIKSN